jgi:hypothetical protein
MAPVCFCIETVVEIVVLSLTEQLQPVFAAGMVTVQPVDAGPVPTLISKDAVLLPPEMDAPDPPQPAAAIVGTVEVTMALHDPKDDPHVANEIPPFKSTAVEALEPRTEEPCLEITQSPVDSVP